MSQSPILPRDRYPTAETSTVVDSDERVDELLDALRDADCRAILEATTDEALSAKEVAETCRLPLSTTYRKLDLLTAAGLLEERTRIRPSGKHPSEYSRAVGTVVVSLGGDGGFELRLTEPDPTDSSPSVFVP